VTTRAWGWASISFALFVISEILTIPITVAAEQIGRVPHPAGLALWAGSRTLLAGIAAFVVGRILLGRLVRSVPAAWIVLVGGVVLAGAWQAVLAEWSTGRFGYFDPDFLGPTAQLYQAVGGVAVASFAALVAPPDAARPVQLTLVLATALNIAIVAANLRGVADGIGPESIPLALTMGVVLVYSLVAAAMGLIATARPAEYPSGS
jgi:hypothetical protein